MQNAKTISLQELQNMRQGIENLITEQLQSESGIVAVPLPHEPNEMEQKFLMSVATKLKLQNPKFDKKPHGDEDIHYFCGTSW